MTKTEIIKFLEDFDDNQEFNISNYDEDLIIYMDKDVEAYKVYKEIISAIADWEHANWQDICEAVNIDDMDWIASLGFVKVNPEVRDNKIYYKIDSEETNKNDKLYKGLFEPATGYWVHQVCHFEDDYSGQMLLPFGDSGKMLCVEYNC